MGNKSPLRRMGKSDLMVSPVGLGCWQFSKGHGFGGKYWPVLTDEKIKGIVRASLEGGINWFDTAEAYGWGESEKALSRTLKLLGKSSEDVIVATKWFPVFKTAKSITKTIDKRLEHLSGFRIDLYQIHQPYSLSSTTAQMNAMAQLVKDHKIRYVGVSNFSVKKMKKAHAELSSHGIDLISNQVVYSILNRKIETNGILDTARELGVSIIAYSPLAQGIVSGKFHDNPELIRSRPGYRKYMSAFKPEGLEKSRPVVQALEKLAEKYNATSSQIALNWIINFCGDSVVTIPGATQLKQAEENAGSFKFKLTRDELEQLDDISTPFKS